MSTNQMNTYADLWQRVRAFVLDYVIILIYLAAITLLIWLLNLFSINEWLFAERVRAQFVAFLLVTLPVTLYFAIRESSTQQATWGKQCVGLKATDYNGERIEFRQAF